MAACNVVSEVSFVVGVTLTNCVMVQLKVMPVIMSLILQKLQYKKLSESSWITCIVVFRALK